MRLYSIDRSQREKENKKKRNERYNVLTETKITKHKIENIASKQ